MVAKLAKQAKTKSLKSIPFNVLIQHNYSNYTVFIQLLVYSYSNYDYYNCTVSIHSKYSRALTF